jgi:hypothetical protein
VGIQRILRRDGGLCDGAAGGERFTRGLRRVGRSGAIAGASGVKQEQTSNWQLANILDEHDPSMGSELKTTFNFKQESAG